MMWIHGGALLMGTGIEAYTNPQYLVQKDNIVVKINYRLSMMGFLSHFDTGQGSQDEIYFSNHYSFRSLSPDKSQKVRKGEITVIWINRPQLNLFMITLKILVVIEIASLSLVYRLAESPFRPKLCILKHLSLSLEP